MDPFALAIALSNRLSELERWSSVFDSWLNRWTTMVVIGVVLEVAFVAWEYRMELGDFRRGTIRSPEKPKLLKYIIEFLGVGLVALGVTGELVVHTRSGKIDTEMRDITRQQVSIANGRAGDALKEAAEANERAAELLAEIQPRELKQQDAIRKSLARFSRRITDLTSPRAFLIIGIYTYRLDPEGLRLAREIQDIFRGRFSSALHADGGLEGLMVNPSGETLFGVTVIGGKNQQEFAATLKSALQSEGGLFVPPGKPPAVQYPVSLDNTVLVLVGAKPLPAPAK
jgi:hypothetical protein